MHGESSEQSFNGGVFPAGDHQVVDMQTQSTLLSADAFVEHALIHKLSLYPKSNTVEARELVVPQLSALHAFVKRIV